MTSSVNGAAIEDAVRAAGLAGKPVCLHSSLKSFGRVDGGAGAVVESWLAANCTLLVPTFSWDEYYVTPPPRHLRPPRNGSTYAALTKHDTGRVFSPASMEIDREIGAIPAAVLALRYGVRGNHPLCSFTAIGPLASRLVGSQTFDDVHAPLETLAELDGYVVLMGVGLTSMTLLHLAEQHAGRAQFMRWARDARGITPVRAGGCSTGFHQLDPALARFETTVTVGRSRWRIFPARAALDAATDAIRRNPSITRCHEPNCRRCEDAIAGGPPPPLRLR